MAVIQHFFHVYSLLHLASSALAILPTLVQILGLLVQCNELGSKSVSYKNDRDEENCTSSNARNDYSTLK